MIEGHLIDIQVKVMHLYSPVPKRKVIKEKKGIVGALGGTTVLVPMSPSSYTYCSSDKLKSVIKKSDPNATADMAHPISMYDFRRYPKIGKLSEMNPNINLSEAGSDFNVDIVVCCASVAFKSKA